MRSFEKEKLLETFVDLLAIPSPTFGEQKVFLHLKKILASFSRFLIYDKKEGLIFSFSLPAANSEAGKHFAFFAHADVVPAHFAPFVKKGRVYGAGASDMKAGLAAFVHLMLHFFRSDSKIAHSKKKAGQHIFSFVFYAAEENPELKENGLYKMIQRKKAFFRSIDFALVGEPTDRTLQLGAVGSAHARVKFYGKACHSARPWQGENALYKAEHFIAAMSKLKPSPSRLAGLDFFNTINITESASEKGKTTLPGWWEANVNFRFAPCFTVQQAKKNFLDQLILAGASRKNIEIYSMVYGGAVIESDFFKNVLKLLQKTYRGKLPIKPKQAWTDVAQLGQLGIPAINYGPGLTAQCHKPGEYAVVKDLVDYVEHLAVWLKSYKLTS